MSDLDVQRSSLNSIGGLIDSIGTANFSADVFGYFHHLVAIDHCVAFVVSEDGTPSTLLAEGHDHHARMTAQELAHDYVSGEFVNDPFLHGSAVGTGRKPCGGARANALLPSELPHTSYRRRFYDRPGISHEINFMERMGRDRFYLCLYRRSGILFSGAEIATIEAYAPLAVKATRKHVCAERSVPVAQCNTAANSIEQRGRLLDRVRSDLEFSGLLSPREADVCAHIALGYNIGAISLIFGITENTASTHRKRAYAKLEISSQNELFARYIDMACYQAH